MKKEHKGRLYVSLPISGHNYDEVYSRCAAAIAKYSRYGWDVITPIEVVRDRSTPYNICIGKCIEQLLTCDAVVLLDGWRDSKGCNLECSVAKIYGIERKFNFDL